MFKKTDIAKLLLDRPDINARVFKIKFDENVNETCFDIS